jgi:hypothetical protein
MRRIVTAVLARVAAIALFVLIGGCKSKNEVDPSSSTTSTSAVTADPRFAGSIRIYHDNINEVRTGQVLSIRLEENQSIPFRWKPDISDDSMIELIHDEIDSSGVTSDLPGAGGQVHIDYFEALRPGECTIGMDWVYIGGDDEIDHTILYSIVIDP